LIAQLVQELVPAQQLVLALAQESVRESQQAQVLAQVLVPQLVQEREQLLVLASEQVPHPPHQQLQSRSQLQRFRLLQHESLSTLRQLAKVLQCQLCRLKLRTMARRQQSCRQLF
jgi:hypothetical protein